MAAKERQAAIDAQKDADAEAAHYYATEREREVKEHVARLEHRRLLDKVLADKKKDEEKRKEMDRVEEEEIEVYAAAKRVFVYIKCSWSFNCPFGFTEND